MKPFKNKNASIKILLVTHKPCEIPKCEYFVPVHAGRAVASEFTKDGNISNENIEWLLKNTIGDDTGVNISDKNRLYCECSALYWAWKNYEQLGNPDYIGLMHYRRHFIFNNDYYVNHKKHNIGLATVFEDFITEKYFSRIGLNKENIERYCAEYDLITTVESDFSKAYYQNCTIKDDYRRNIPGAKVKDFDLMIDFIKQEYPNMTQVVDRMTAGCSKSMYSMFIMKKELFFEYCEFLFTILSKIENICGEFDNYSVNGKRTLGYLAETMFAFFTKYQEIKGVKHCKLGVTCVKHPEPLSDLYQIIDKKHSNFIKYILGKIKYMFTIGRFNQEKQKIIYKSYKKQYKNAEKLKRLINNL